MVSFGPQQGRHKVSLQSPVVLCGLRHGISTRSAARRATRIYNFISGEGGANPPPSEAELFGALIACAIRAGRFGNLMRLFGEKRRLWHQRWRTIRDHLVVANLGLVHAAAKRFPCWTLNREEQQSAGMLALLRAVDSFNPWLGFCFSTYAFHAIRRSLIAEGRKETVYQSRFRHEHPDWVDEGVRGDLGLRADRLRRALMENRAELDARERMIIASRFPWDQGNGATLGEVAAILGLSREGVRQIQKKGLAKLRQILEADPHMQ